MRTKSYQTILLWMWHPFEDEQTKGGIVVEQVTIGGQVVCSGQPCIGIVLCFSLVLFSKMFYLVHSSIVTQYHASENMSTMACGIFF